MLPLKSIMSSVTPKIIILVISYLCLLIGTILGLLGSYRMDVLRADVANANAARDAAEHRRVTQETELKTRETAVAEGEAKIAEAESKIAELTQLQKDKTELQTKLEEKQNEINSLQKRIEEPGATARPSESPAAASTPEQQPAPASESLAAASTPEQQPTPAAPSLEIKSEQVEGTTPPPRQPKRQKIAATTTPPVAGSPRGTTSISSATTLATYAPKPEYPPQVREQQVTGSGVCVVDVDPGSGNVTEASMAESTGNKMLDDSTVRTLRKWRFKPGTVSRVRIPIEFR
jgi:TonB family protein